MAGFRRATAVAIAIAIATAAVTLTACSTPPDSLDPDTPSGATPIPSSPRIPSNQQDAQDTVQRYLQQTLDALPKGSTLDGRRYTVGDGTTYCEDDPAGTGSPVHVEDWRDITLPPGSDFAAVISETGELWKRWGWRVLERDQFSRPNRFGYAPDGYVLQIESRPDPKYPPSLVASSPCFAGILRSDKVARSLVLRQNP